MPNISEATAAASGDVGVAGSQEAVDPVRWGQGYRSGGNPRGTNLQRFRQQRGQLSRCTRLFRGAQVDDRGGRFHGTTPSISLLNPIRYEVCRRTSGSGSIFRPGRAENHCPGGVPRSRSFAAGNSRRAQSACNSPWMLSRFRRDFAPARMQTARLVTLQ